MLSAKRKRSIGRIRKPGKAGTRRNDPSALTSYIGFLNGSVSSTARRMKINQRERLVNCMRSGIEAVEKRDFTTAMGIFDDVLRMQPGCSQAWNNKGVCYLRMGKMRSAAICFDKAIRINPDYKLAWINKHFVEFQVKIREEPPGQALVKLALH